ncbi:MAG: hypothetical protein Q9203_007395, partial [Teloschistes exilis]
YDEAGLEDAAREDAGEGGGSIAKYLFKCINNYGNIEYRKYCQNGCIHGATDQVSYCVLEPESSFTVQIQNH